MDHDNTIPSQLGPMATIPSALGPVAGPATRKSGTSGGTGGMVKLLLLAAFVALVVYLTR